MAKLQWTGPSTYVDGLPYGEADHGGYEIEVNGEAAVAIPLGWDADNHYEFPIADLPHIKQGDNAARMRTVAANGEVSDWTPVVMFSFRSKPRASADLVVA